MTETTIEWNLAFPRDEVVVGLEKLLGQYGYAYTRSDTDTITRFVATVAAGSLWLVAQPLLTRQSPFNPLGMFQRTLLTMTFTGVGEEEEKTFMHRLTLAFLRAGG